MVLNWNAVLAARERGDLTGAIKLRRSEWEADGLVGMQESAEAEERAWWLANKPVARGVNTRSVGIHWVREARR